MNPGASLGCISPRSRSAPDRTQHAPVPCDGVCRESQGDRRSGGPAGSAGTSLRPEPARDQGSVKDWSARAASLPGCRPADACHVQVVVMASAYDTFGAPFGLPSVGVGGCTAVPWA